MNLRLNRPLGCGRHAIQRETRSTVAGLMGETTRKQETNP
jgi:hypothetical protein